MGESFIKWQLVKLFGYVQLNVQLVYLECRVFLSTSSHVLDILVLC